MFRASQFRGILVHDRGKKCCRLRQQCCEPSWRGRTNSRWVLDIVGLRPYYGSSTRCHAIVSFLRVCRSFNSGAASLFAISVSS
jgi:hypothetical protein